MDAHGEEVVKAECAPYEASLADAAGNVGGEAVGAGDVGAFGSPDAARHIMGMLSQEAMAEAQEVSDLLHTIDDSLAETEAKAKPRKRARTSDALIECAGASGRPPHIPRLAAMDVEPLAGMPALDRVPAMGDPQMAAIASLLDTSFDSPTKDFHLRKFAFNAVAVLAQAVLNKSDAEKQNETVMRLTLQKMHEKYTSLANECSDFQCRLETEVVSTLLSLVAPAPASTAKRNAGGMHLPPPPSLPPLLPCLHACVRVRDSDIIRGALPPSPLPSHPFHHSLAFLLP